MRIFGSAELAIQTRQESFRARAQETIHVLAWFFAGNVDRHDFAQHSQRVSQRK